VWRSAIPKSGSAIVHQANGEHELEDTMFGLLNGTLDVLVATTIIDSGR